MINIKVHQFILVIILIISFSSTVDYYVKINSIIGYILLLGWIIWAAITFIHNCFRFKDKNLKITLKFTLMFAFIPKLIIYGYTIILILFGMTDVRYLSTNIQTFINGLSAISIYYFFKEKSLKLSFVALLITYLIQGLFMVLSRGNVITFEFHDLAFAIGYLILYITFKSENSRINVLFLIFSLLLFILAGKRIGFAALVMSFLWIFLAKKIPCHIFCFWI